MNLRIDTKLAALALLGALVLGACDSGGTATVPRPTGTTAQSTVVKGTPAVPLPQTTAQVPAAQPSGQVPAAQPSTAATVVTTTTVKPVGGTPTVSGTTSSGVTPATAAAEEGALILTAQKLGTEAGGFGDGRTINLPPGFKIQVYATNLNGVRWLGLSPEGVVYATLKADGRVVTLKDTNNDGVADEVTTFADNVGAVQGIDFHDGAVYVANEGQIVRLQDTNNDGKADKKDVIADDLPTGSGHSTRTIAFGPDGNLYVSVGSSCNVCVETNEKRAAISLYSAEGKFQRVYAKGLRNAVGIVFNSITGDLWATNNGRDELGDNVPPETIYNVQDGANYGWPYCYGNQITDKTQDVPTGYCAKTSGPAVEMQAHSAPLGLAFYTGNMFPASYKGDLFVAFHGSWNRSVPTGYKVVRIRFANNQPSTTAGDLLVEDFATGWNDNGSVWGRPVDPMVAPDGSLLLTDDAASVIYRIYYAGDKAS
jgi:putative membrane-bound dehydrogenase-like protein